MPGILVSGNISFMQVQLNNLLIQINYASRGFACDSTGFLLVYFAFVIIIIIIIINNLLQYSNWNLCLQRLLYDRMNITLFLLLSHLLALLKAPQWKVGLGLAADSVDLTQCEDRTVRHINRIALRSGGTMQAAPNADDQLQ